MYEPNAELIKIMILSESLHCCHMHEHTATEPGGEKGARCGRPGSKCPMLCAALHGHEELHLNNIVVSCGHSDKT
jgi:hypothetical protein